MCLSLTPHTPSPHNPSHPPHAHVSLTLPTPHEPWQGQPPPPCPRSHDTQPRPPKSSQHTPFTHLRLAQHRAGLQCSLTFTLAQPLTVLLRSLFICCPRTQPWQDEFNTSKCCAICGEVLIAESPREKKCNSTKCGGRIVNRYTGVGCRVTSLRPTSCSRWSPIAMPCVDVFGNAETSTLL